MQKQVFPSLLTHYTIIFLKIKRKLVYLDKQLGKTDQLKYVYSQICSYGQYDYVLEQMTCFRVITVQLPEKLKLQLTIVSAPPR